MDNKHYEIKNSHNRDKFIFFDEESHTYKITFCSVLTAPLKASQQQGNENEDHDCVGISGNQDFSSIDGEIYSSVTTIIHKYFPKFESGKIINKMMSSSSWKRSPYYGKTKEQIEKEWEQNRSEAASLGTKIHNWIENFYLSGNICPSEEASQSKSFQNFLEFHETYGWKPYRTEWRVYSEICKIAGSIDIVFEGSSAGKVKIFDWKNSKEIKQENKYEKGFPPLDHIPNCNFYHYSLQLNLYKWIIEKHYDLVVEEMGLIIVHQNFPTFLKYEVKDMKKETQDLIDHYTFTICNQ